MVRKSVPNAESSNNSDGLLLKLRNGRYHLTGTLRIGKRAVRIRETTGISERSPNAKEEANLYKIRRTQEIVDELLHGKTPDVPFSVVALKYLESRQPGAADFRNAVELDAKFGSTPIGKMSADNIEKFYAKRFPNHAASTIRRHQNTLSAILSHALEMEVLEYVPYFRKTKVKHKKGANMRKKFLPGEMEFIINALPRHAKPIVATILCTGARVGQTLWLVRDDFILVKGNGRIFFPDSKNGNAYDRALHDFAVDILLEWLQSRKDNLDEMFLTPRNEPYVYRKGGGGQIKEVFDTARKKLVEHYLAKGENRRAKAVEKITPHWLRHSFANTMRDDGADLMDIKEAGMWESSKVVEDHYLSNTPQRVETQVRSLKFGTNLTHGQKTENKDVGKSKG